MEKDIAAQSSYWHHGESQIRMEWERNHGSASDLNGSSQKEKRSTDIGRAATGVTDQVEVVWYGIGSIQRWAEVYIG